MFHCMEDMQYLFDGGWIDSWRYTHGSFTQYSWYSNKGNGFRIDHIFLSPILKPYLAEAYFLMGNVSRSYRITLCLLQSYCFNSYALQCKGWTVNPQPLFSLFIIRHNRSHDLPIFCGMIGVKKMG